MEREVNIYALVHPKTGEVKYIGKTINSLSQRLTEHISTSKRYNYKLTSWIKSLNGERPLIELIDIVKLNEWQFWEQHYISLYKFFGFDLKNIGLGGEIDNTGRKASEETKLKMSLNRKNNPLYKKKKGPMNEKGKQLRKIGSLTTFAEKLNIDESFINKVYKLIDEDKNSLRETAKILNVPYNRIRGIYTLKQYNYLIK